LPFVLFGLLFTAYPLAEVARMAGSDVRIHGGRFTWHWTGLDNLRGILADGAAWHALGNTVVFVVSSVGLSVLAGLALALLVDRSVSLLRIARHVLIWPAVIAPVVVSLMWLLILSPTAGGLNKLLRTLALPEQGWLGEGGTAMAAIVAVDVWHWTPVVFLMLYTALRAMDTSLLEAARIDGAKESQIIGRIVLPALRRAIGVVIVIRVIMGVKAFDEMYVLTHGGPDGATTLVSQHIKSLFFDNLELGAAAAFSLTVVVVTAIALGVFLFIRSKAAE
jgi:multiple sugar transport system permease protein